MLLKQPANLLGNYHLSAKVEHAVSKLLIGLIAHHQRVPDKYLVNRSGEVSREIQYVLLNIETLTHRKSVE